MAFSESERSSLLAVKGVGPTVLARLESLGLDEVGALAQADAREVVAQLAERLGSTCWKNSPQARRAIEGAIAWAESQRTSA
ncbi:recombinase RecA [Comamonas serinivorans]|uniref:Recombinase RecA n=1 Tax=Comamonas serinivorans TaxID=1082851 RepID=A0A1Y0ENM1_9BURK|nr:recombinase RecA [Comamonas serinivorans]ARU05040.1 recombinase RecA [Comamonas serinivorans]